MQLAARRPLDPSTPTSSTPPSHRLVPHPSIVHPPDLGPSPRGGLLLQAAHHVVCVGESGEQPDGDQRETNLEEDQVFSAATVLRIDNHPDSQGRETDLT